MKFLYIVLSVFAIALMLGCSNDSNTSSLNEEEKIERNVEKVEAFLESVVSQCNDIVELESFLEDIDKLDGVENSWIDGNSLCIKVKDAGILVWFFPSEEIPIDESTINVLSKEIMKSRSVQESSVEICENKKVCIINQFSEDPNEIRQEYGKYCHNFKETLVYGYGFKENEVDVIEADGLTLEFIANTLPQYGIICFGTHGGYIDGKHWLLTGQLVDFHGAMDKWRSDLIRPFNLVLENENTGEKIIKEYFAFNEDFISEYSNRYSDNSIMFCSACQSLKGNENLAKTFISKNLGGYVGLNEINYKGRYNGFVFMKNMIVYSTTLSEEYQRSKFKFKQDESYSVNKVKAKHEPAELLYYPEDCNIVIRGDIGTIVKYTQTKTPKCEEDSVFFSLNVEMTYTNPNTDMKEWGVALFRENEVVEKFPVADMAEETQSVDVSVEMLKDQFDIDYKNYVATPKDQWFVGVYEVNNHGVTLFGRNKTELQLLYDRKPSITLVDLVVGETVDIDESKWDRQIFFNYKRKVTGALFMDEYYQYCEGSWTDEGKQESEAPWDATWWYPGDSWVKFSSDNKPRTSYIYYVAVVNGVEIRSTNYLRFEYNGSTCTISLVDGTVDSRAAFSVGGGDDLNASSGNTTCAICLE